ncbi:MAG: CARDB domain-containing protein [Janthinobacterium lividum]
MKKNYFHYLMLLLGVAYASLRPTTGCAQTYLTPTTGTTSITTCAGTLYDDGGASGNYSAYDDGTITILPATAGNKVRLEFSSFNVESGYDYLYIYDGNSTSATLIGTYSGAVSPGIIYGTTTTGALTLRFTSDNVVQYSGFAASISCVTSVPLPDLTVQGATVSPTAVVAGNSVSASSQVYNLNGGTANSSNLGYYLSTDNILSSNDVLLGSAAGSALGAGQTSARYTTLTIPTATVPGTYYVLFAADYQNQVTESNEANNVTAVGITVQLASPDLVIQSAALSATSVQAGSALSFNCYIYNQGNTTASSSSVGFYFSTDAILDASDVLLATQYGTALSAGYSNYRSSTAAVPNNTTPGTYYILFAADYQNQVAEGDETNNVTAVSFTVLAPGPDLTVTQQYLNSYSLPAGGTTTTYAYINNVGNQVASSSNLGFYLSTNTVFDAADVLLTTSTGTALAAGGSSYRSATLTVPLGTSAGTYYVLYVADPANAVAESNENNNVVWQSLTVYAPTIDLTIYSAYLTPSQVSPGGTVSVSGYEYNQGNANAGSHRVGYYLSTNAILDASDVLLGNSPIASVSATYSTSFSSTLTIPAATATGTYYVLFVADDLNQIAESNENNNLSYQTLQVVAPGIDLTISSAYTSTSQSVASGTLSVSCYLNNLGTTSTAANAATVGYYLSTNTIFDASDVLMSSSPGVTVGANGSVYRSASVTVPTGTTAGTYYVLFVADPSNTVAETNENNNVAYQYLLVVAPTIDLYPYSPYLSVTYATAGSSITTSSYLYNQGNAVASPATMGYYLSTNTVLDASDVLLSSNTISSIAGNSYSSVYGSATIPATTPTGTYYILFVADYLNQLVESNENNNVAYQYIQVTGVGPDLITTSSYLGFSSVAAGSSVSASTYIYNQGNSVASSSNAGFYLSTNTVFDAADVLLTSTTGGALGVQQSSLLTVNLPIPAGTAAGGYYVLFVADPGNLVAESNEANNVTYQYLTVTGPFTGTLVPDAGTATITSCSATVYDNGGTGNYANNSNGTLVINPGTANGLVRLAFNSFNTEYGADFLQVYDGTSTSAPLLGTYTGSTLPGAITASNASGALTLLFYSNSSVTSTGFVATVSCVQRLATLAQQTAGYDINVLPNPVAGGNVLRVQLTGAGQPVAATLTLLNSLGQLVTSQPLQLSPARQNEAQIPTAGLATGMYVLRLSGNGLNVVRQVIVE